MLKKSMILLFVVVLLFSGCSKIGRPDGMTAESTVAYYFWQWDAKNSEGENSVKHPSLRYNNLEEHQGLDYVRILSCEKTKSVDLSSFGLYKDAYDTVQVMATFEIAFEEGSKASINNGRHTYMFNLIKEKEDSQWEIISYERE